MALPPAEQILWGTGFENVIDFDYPRVLDSPRAWRRPMAGSERVKNRAGVVDAWVTGYEYCLAGRARWFQRTDWDNPVGLQAFLDWAGQGNTFRFVPDKTNPLFYVDGCYLDAPFDSLDPQLEQADGSQSLDLTICNPTVSFGQALRGVMFEYAPGASLTDPVAASFSRASTAARIAKDLSLFTEAAGTLRDRHYNGTLRTTLLEASRTNSCLFSEQLDNGAWVADGTTVTPDATTAPDGTTSMDKLVETAATANHQRYQAFTITDSEYVAISCFVKAAERSKLRFIFVDGATGNFFGALIDTVAQTATSAQAGTGVQSLGPFITPLGNGVYYVRATGRLAAGVTATRLYCGLRDASGNANYTGDGASGAYYWGLQVERLGTASPLHSSSYIKTTSGPVARSADAFSWPHSYVPQGSFFYTKFVERGNTQGTGTIRLWSLGDSVTPPALYITYNAQYGSRLTINGVTTAATVAPVPNIGDTVELLLWWDSTGNAQLAIAINGGAPTIGAATGAHSQWPPAAWGSPANTLRLGIGDLTALMQVKMGPLTFGGVTRNTIAAAVAA